jgi:cobalamin biosynthesis protein CobT
MMDDQVKDKGKGRDLGNIGEVSESGSESGDKDEDEDEDEGGLKSQSDGEDEGGDDGEGGDEGEDEGEDDGENSGKEKDKESEDAGKVNSAGIDQDVEMMDINKVETRVANAAMANTIEVTTSEGE